MLLCIITATILKSENLRRFLCSDYGGVRKKTENTRKNPRVDGGIGTKKETPAIFAPKHQSPPKKNANQNNPRPKNG